MEQEQMAQEMRSRLRQMQALAGGGDPDDAPPAKSDDMRPTVVHRRPEWDDDYAGDEDVLGLPAVDEAGESATDDDDEEDVAEGDDDTYYDNDAVSLSATDTSGACGRLILRTGRRPFVLAVQRRPAKRSALGSIRCAAEGGARCAHCSAAEQRGKGLLSLPWLVGGWGRVAGRALRGVAVPGLNADWAGPMLLTARPSTALNRRHDVPAALAAAGVRCIVNLQELWEHPGCGLGLQPCGYSYDPEEFALAGIAHCPMGWKDMGAPPLERLLDLVQVIDGYVSSGGEPGKVAIHCHAGLGRTGLVAAAYLLYAGWGNVSVDDALASTRAARPGSVQTATQVACVRGFDVMLTGMRLVFSSPESRFTLSRALERQARIGHGEPARLRRSGAPRLVHEATLRLATIARCDGPEAVLRAIGRHEHASHRDWETTERERLVEIESLNRGEWALVTDSVDPEQLADLLLVYLHTLARPVCDCSRRSLAALADWAAVASEEALPTVQCCLTLQSALRPSRAALYKRSARVLGRALHSESANATSLELAIFSLAGFSEHSLI